VSGRFTSNTVEVVHVDAVDLKQSLKSSQVVAHCCCVDCVTSELRQSPRAVADVPRGAEESEQTRGQEVIWQSNNPSLYTPPLQTPCRTYFLLTVTNRLAMAARPGSEQHDREISG
jgi:hypothetical protein